VPERKLKCYIYSTYTG